MGKPATLAIVFSKRCVLVEYGHWGDQAKPVLTIDRKLLVSDILRSLLEPSAYISFVTYILFKPRPDFHERVQELQNIIDLFVEVYQLVLIKENAVSWKRIGFKLYILVMYRLLMFIMFQI